MQNLLKLLLFVLPVQTYSASSKQADEWLCLATNIYFEARGEPFRGQLAVKDVTLNRGGNVCKTVFEPSQFSWTAQIPWKTVSSFLSDSPKNLSNKELKAWNFAKFVAKSKVTVLPKAYKHFHTLAVSPAWTKPGIVIGNHKFMKDVDVRTNTAARPSVGRNRKMVKR